MKRILCLVGLLGDFATPTLAQKSSNPTVTFDTYANYNRARSALRPGQEGEVAFVSDALSNRFRETEFMLNLKADYALGKGKWRVTGGYKIQSLAYKTFQGTETNAIEPVTGPRTKAQPPSACSRLKRVVPVKLGHEQADNGLLPQAGQLFRVHNSNVAVVDVDKALIFKVAQGTDNGLHRSPYQL